MIGSFNNLNNGLSTGNAYYTYYGGQQPERETHFCSNPAIAGRLLQLTTAYYRDPLSFVFSAFMVDSVGITNCSRL